MDFRLLGPLEVWDRARGVELRRPKQRALLAILLLRPREAVSSDALIDALWGESPPRTARAALQNYVAQLRRALGPGSSSRAAAYLLDVAPEQIDLGRFERLVAESREAEGDERVAKLREALALWQGPPLADLAFEPFAAQEISRLEELRTSALEDLIDAQLALGAGAELLDRLEALVASHPFRERLRGQQMLALYRDGRQADALEAYQETRRTLVDELGIEPGTALRELEQAILRQDPALAPPGRPPRREAGPPEERRKVVTILFADVACPDTFDPELLRKTSMDALAPMRAVLERHGATIEQRAGDEVMAVFGVPRAHEDEQLRAARAAVELRAEIGALSDVLEQSGRGRIELRVGIATGEVLTGADDSATGFVAGPAVTLAKRILQSAQPGEILLGPKTVGLLGDAAVTDPAGDAGRLLELVEGVQAPGRHLETPLVGRRAELARLREAFAGVVEERACRLCLLLGEPGIGKTRLASELTAELDGEATILVGHCVSYGKGRRTCRSQRSSAASGTAPTARAARGRRARRADRGGLADLSGEAQAGASGGGNVLGRSPPARVSGPRGSRLALFEDLHWGEPTLLDRSTTSRRTSPSRRSSCSGWPGRSCSGRGPTGRRAESVLLAPLSADDAQTLVDTLGRASAPLRAKVVRTAGNPLFIEPSGTRAEDGRGRVHASVARVAAREPPRPSRGRGSCRFCSGPPWSGASSGVAPSSSSCRRSGRRVSASTWSSWAGRDCSSRAADGGVPLPACADPRCRVRDTPEGATRRAAQRFGRWLASHQTGSDELIGFHFEQAHDYRSELDPDDSASPGLAAEAGDHLSTAGLRAAKRGDMPAASNLLTRASSLLDASEVARRDLLTELGLVRWRRGEVGDAQRLFEKSLQNAVSGTTGGASYGRGRSLRT
jgi:DNA-binding SARP family transcriptional activator